MDAGVPIENHVAGIAMGIVIDKDLEAFKKPILNRTELKDQIEYVQRLSGRSGQDSINIAMEVLSDMEKGTRYPPAMKPMSTSIEIASLIQHMVEDISLKKMSASAEK